MFPNASLPQFTPADQLHRCRWRFALACVALATPAATSLSVPFAAHGQPAAFPAKPVRIIVLVAPGGGIDLVARVVAPRLADELGQAVIVENRAGNAMVTGTAAVAKAAPDGHTLGLNNTNRNRFCPRCSGDLVSV